MFHRPRLRGSCLESVGQHRRCSPHLASTRLRQAHPCRRRLRRRSSHHQLAANHHRNDLRATRQIDRGKDAESADVYLPRDASKRRAILVQPRSSRTLESALSKPIGFEMRRTSSRSSGGFGGRSRTLEQRPPSSESDLCLLQLEQHREIDERRRRTARCSGAQLRQRMG